MDKEDIQKVWAAYQKVQEAVKKKLDPVGKADADIDNDGDVDSSDKYLHKRRKAIGKAMKKEEVEQDPNKANKEMMKDKFTASDKKMVDGHGGIDPKTPEVDGMKAADQTAASIKASEPGETHKNREADKTQGDKAIIQSPTSVKEAKTFVELMKAFMEK